MIARVNDPRNQQHFDLLGITQTVCATSSILGLVEHEVPERSSSSASSSARANRPQRGHVALRGDRSTWS